MSTRIDKSVVLRVIPDSLDRIVNLLSKIVEPLIRYGVAIAGTVLFAMMALTFLDVAGRWILNTPISGSLEITEFIMAIGVSFGLSYCALRKGHIRVDLILQLASKKANYWFDLFTYGISFIIYVLISWQVWLNAVSIMNSKLSSAVLYIPVYPFIFIVVLGTALLALILLRDFLKSLVEVMR